MDVFTEVWTLQKREEIINLKMKELKTELDSLKNQRQEILQSHLIESPGMTENNRFQIKSRKGGGVRNRNVGKLMEKYPYNEHPYLYKVESGVALLEDNDFTYDQTLEFCEVSPTSYTYTVTEKDSVGEMAKRMLGRSKK